MRKGRLVEFAAKVDAAFGGNGPDLVELAIRLKNGLIVTRQKFDPLHPKRQRTVTIARHANLPKGVFKSGPNKGRDRVAAITQSDMTKSHAQLTYRRIGKKKNHVEAIWSPTTGPLSKGSERGRSAALISKTFLPHLDRRGIISTTEARNFGGSAAGFSKRPGGIATKDLVRHYERMGYNIDTQKIDQKVARYSTPLDRAIQRAILTHDAVPMRREPRIRA